MPIIGTIASSTRQGLVTDLGAMFPLQVITVGPSGASTVTFTNIPSTYTHLQVRGFASTTSSQNHLYYFNGDNTPTNYRYHFIAANGSTVTAGSAINSGYLGYNDPGSSFAAWVLDILDYANTNKNKTMRDIMGTDGNGSGHMMMSSSLWLSTAAITSIQFFCTGGASYAQNSQFALYGIKAAS